MDDMLEDLFLPAMDVLDGDDLSLYREMMERAITPRGPDHIPYLWFWYGTGRNGRTTLLKSISKHLVTCDVHPDNPFGLLDLTNKTQLVTIDNCRRLEALDEYLDKGVYSVRSMMNSPRLLHARQRPDLVVIVDTPPPSGERHRVIKFRKQF